jgi:hypothetical protein
MLGVAICPGPGGVAEVGVHYLEVANQVVLTELAAASSQVCASRV